MRILRSKYACAILAAATTALTGGAAYACHEPGHNCAFPDRLKVAVSWSYLGINTTRANERIREIVEGGGGEFYSVDATGSPEKQLQQINNFVAMGVNLILISPTDSNTRYLLPLINQASQAGVHFVSMGTPIQSSKVVTVHFDYKLAGRLEATKMLSAKPNGNFIVFEPSEKEGREREIFEGKMEILQPKIDNGTVALVAKVNEDNWETSWQNVVGSSIQGVDAVLTTEDEITQNIADKIKQQNSRNSVVVSGQDPIPDAFKRIADGTQLVTVWGDTAELAATATYIGVGLVSGEHKVDEFVLPASSTRVAPYEFVLSPVAISKDNVSVLVDNGIISATELCAGVSNDRPPACQ